MGKKIIVISTSLRADSNSDALAKAFAEGAKEAGNEVEYVTLRGKKIAFCAGCLACQKAGHCVINDDAIEIERKVCEADAVVFATPIYYYEMSGQMKTLIDRMNALFSKNYHFREVYILTTAADSEEWVPDRAVSGLQGWIDCFENVEMKGSVFCGGVGGPGAIKGSAKLQEAYILGKNA